MFSIASIPYRNAFAAAAVYCLVVSAAGQTASPVPVPAPPKTNDASAERILLPPSVKDPLEPMNRVIWAFNRGLMTQVIKPSARVYRFIVIKPVRTGIANFGRNLSYPGRLLNNLLQGKWKGARDETDRFFCNTVVGAGGFVDVATRWKIPKSDADFGQTFGQWGWKAHCYLMLPLMGPSNERDAVGLGADALANPLSYLSPYSFEVGNPPTYLSPYAYYGYVVLYNNLTDTVDEYVRFNETRKDAYAELQYAWTFARANQVADFHVKGKQDEASLETLQSVFFTPHDREFVNRAKTEFVLLPSTGKQLKFTLWLQRKKAPIVYIVPGLASHRLADTAVALAELVYQKGFSVVSVSNPYNFEFIERASTAAMPAYTPVDAHDLHVALTEIHRRLEAMFPGRLTAKALLGYSMGAFQMLFVAAAESTNRSSLIEFDRYVAINTPVRLRHGLSKLDEFYRAPLTWPASQRATNLENTFLKVAALSRGSLTPQMSLPFDAVESKFLIGLEFRFLLRDVIFTSQQHNDQGILKHPFRDLRRAPVYREIMEYSYQDYFDRFATPYYRKRGIDLTTPEVLAAASDLRTYTGALQANQKIRLIVNRNDFLLADEDMAWLQATFRSDQMTIFETGGHLGNLTHPAVQKAILGTLEDLVPVDSRR